MNISWNSHSLFPFQYTSHMHRLPLSIQQKPISKREWMFPILWPVLYHWGLHYHATRRNAASTRATFHPRKHQLHLNCIADLHKTLDPVSHESQSVFVIKTSRLILFREIITLYSEAQLQCEYEPGTSSCSNRCFTGLKYRTLQFPGVLITSLPPNEYVQNCNAPPPAIHINSTQSLTRCFEMQLAKGDAPQHCKFHKSSP